MLKKLLSSLLALCISASLTAPAFAAEVDTTAPNGELLAEAAQNEIPAHLGEKIETPYGWEMTVAVTNPDGSTSYETMQYVEAPHEGPCKVCPVHFQEYWEAMGEAETGNTENTAEFLEIEVGVEPTEIEVSEYLVEEVEIEGVDEVPLDVLDATDPVASAYTPVVEFRPTPVPVKEEIEADTGYYVLDGHGIVTVAGNFQKDGLFLEAAEDGPNLLDTLQGKAHEHYTLNVYDGIKRITDLPKGMKVSFKIPSHFGSDVQAYRYVHGDTIVGLESTCEDGQISFITDELGTFILVDESSDISTVDPEPGPDESWAEDEEMGTTGSLWLPEYHNGGVYFEGFDGPCTYSVNFFLERNPVLKEVAGTYFKRRGVNVDIEISRDWYAATLKGSNGYEVTAYNWHCNSDLQSGEFELVPFTRNDGGNGTLAIYREESLYAIPCNGETLYFWGIRPQAIELCERLGLEGFAACLETRGRLVSSVLSWVVRNQNGGYDVVTR